MQYQNLQVGGFFPPLRGAGECVAVNVDSSGILLAYNFNRPSAREIAAMGEAQPFEIRFVRISDILYVLTKCGSLNWTDAPFTPHLSPGAPLQPITNSSDGYALTLMMVDASSNTIKSLRMIGLGNRFSKALKAEIDSLSEKPLDLDMYNRSIRINNILRSTSDLVQLAYPNRYKLK